MFSSVAQLCPTLCDPMDSTTPGLPVHHQLPQFTQTHVHWFGDAISSSVAPFSSCPQSFPASGSFPVSQLFASGGQSTGVSPSTSVLPVNTQDGLVGSPCSPRDSQESSPTPQFKSINSSALGLLHSPTLTPIHDRRKNHSLDYMDICWQSNALLLNMLSRLVITSLPRSEHFLISWLQSPSAVILEPRGKNVSQFPLFPHLFAMKWWDQMPWSSFSECWALSQLFHFHQEAL